MDRGYFGAWGIDLDADDFARALAAIGVLERAKRIPDSPIDAKAIARALVAMIGDARASIPYWPDRFLLEVRSAFAGPADHRAPGSLPPARALAEAWSRVVQKRRPRLAIEPRFDPSWAFGSGRYVDALWFVEQLSRPAVRAASVYVRHEETSARVVWSWPIRVGVLAGAGSSRLREAVARSRRRDVVTLVEGAGAPCDLLLAPSSLRLAVADVLRSPTRLEASCVLVLGGSGATSDGAEPLLQALLAEVRTAGAGMLLLEEDARARWFDALVKQLADGRALDEALFAASTTVGVGAPWLVASEQLVEAARAPAPGVKRPAIKRPMKPAAKRAARRPLAQPGADAPGRTGRRFGFSVVLPSPEPTELELLSPDGMPADDPRRGRPPRRAPEARPEPEARSLLVEVLPWSEQEGVGSCVREPLRAPASYAADVRIGLPRPCAVQASEPFPAQLLPPSPSGHRLTVVFHELRAGEPAEAKPRQPQLATLHLPQHGDSTVCRFFFRTRKGSGPYRARLIVLHRNRVLQTAILEAALQGSSEAPAPDEPIQLRVENAVRRSFDELERRRPFDAAFVVNSESVTTIGEKRVNFARPVGVDKTTQIISNRLSDESKTETARGLDNERIVELLWFLAHQGHVLWEAMMRAAQESSPGEDISWLEGAQRIQVVEAREGAFLPLEFFYERDAPKEGAPLCKNARQALLTGTCAQACGDAAPSEAICPLAFWGASRVIERQTHGGRPIGSGEVEVSLDPSVKRDALDVLRYALLGASVRVRSADAKSVLRDLKKATHEGAQQAESWESWEANVQQTGPSLLVLLPHSLVDPKAELPALEISSTKLRNSEIRSEHVIRKDGVAPPVVLLLGCDTQRVGQGYQNFVSAFKHRGAAIVVSTVATVLGRDAAKFARAFVKRLSEHTKDGTLTLGDALLQIRREMLAEGSPFALCLAAHGDTDWRL